MKSLKFDLLVTPLPAERFLSRSPAGSGSQLLSKSAIPAIRASPALLMFVASFSSAFAACPQRSQTKRAGVLRLFLLTCPHTALLCDVYCAGTLMRSPPLSFCLYSIRYAASPKPLRRSARLRPTLALALVPSFPPRCLLRIGSYS